jgi:large subunit ribosomal protein L17
MRHRVDHRKLNRTASHRKAMLCNMVTSLFDKERITTTDAKAKEARRLAERLITRARKGYNAHQEGLSLKEAGKDEEAQQMEAVALAHWRQAGRFVRRTSVLKKLFEEIAPQFVDRDGGYTRIIRMSRRLGDNAQTVLLELIGTEKTRKPAAAKGTDEAQADKKKKAKSETKSEAKSSESTKEKKESKSKTKTKAKSKSSRKKESETDRDLKSEKKSRSKSSKTSDSKSKKGSTRRKSKSKD